MRDRELQILQSGITEGVDVGGCPVDNCELKEDLKTIKTQVSDTHDYILEQRVLKAEKQARHESLMGNLKMFSMMLSIVGALIGAAFWLSAHIDPATRAAYLAR